jgi:hypothetical protein
MDERGYTPRVLVKPACAGASCGVFLPAFLRHRSVPWRFHTRIQHRRRCEYQTVCGRDLRSGSLGHARFQRGEVCFWHRSWGENLSLAALGIPGSSRVDANRHGRGITKGGLLHRMRRHRERRTRESISTEHRAGFPILNTSYVRRYEADLASGGPKGLDRARNELAKRGIRLILVAADHPEEAAASQKPESKGDGAICLNASSVRIPKDASPAGGTDVKPGDYVRFEVSDAGVGMEPGVQAQMFDPLFTRGTGIGSSGQDPSGA